MSHTRTTSRAGGRAGSARTAGRTRSAAALLDRDAAPTPTDPSTTGEPTPGRPGKDRAATPAAGVNPTEAPARSRGSRTARRNRLVRRSGPPRIRPMAGVLAVARSPRHRFLLACTGVLALGFLLVLLLNTVISQGAFRQHALEIALVHASEAEERLSRQAQLAEAPLEVERRARALGMVPAGSPVFLRLSDGKVLGVPVPAPDQGKVSFAGAPGWQAPKPTPQPTLPGAMPTPVATVQTPAATSPAAKAPAATPQATPTASASPRATPPADPAASAPAASPTPAATGGTR